MAVLRVSVFFRRSWSAQRWPMMCCRDGRRSRATPSPRARTCSASGGRGRPRAPPEEAPARSPRARCRVPAVPRYRPGAPAAEDHTGAGERTGTRNLAGSGAEALGYPSRDSWTWEPSPVRGLAEGPGQVAGSLAAAHPGQKRSSSFRSASPLRHLSTIRFASSGAIRCRKEAKHSACRASQLAHRRPSLSSTRSLGLAFRLAIPFQAKLIRCRATTSRSGSRSSSHCWPVIATSPTRAWAYRCAYRGS